jgi:hypothetical protein
MINWAKTNDIFGRSDLNGFRPKVYVSCDSCGKDSIRNKSRIINNNIEWNCPKCVSNRDDVKLKLHHSTSNLWNDENYKNNISKKVKICGLKTRNH